MFDVNGWEFVIIIAVALLVIGPERLPQYVARLREWIRDLRRLAEGARGQLREQMGTEFDDIDWSAYDPRQYDPRRIVREALADTWEATDPDRGATTTSTETSGSPAASPAAAGGAASAGVAQFSGVGAVGAVGAGGAESAGRLVTPRYDAGHDPALPVPFDAEAT